MGVPQRLCTPREGGLGLRAQGSQLRVLVLGVLGGSGQLRAWQHGFGLYDRISAYIYIYIYVYVLYIHVYIYTQSLLYGQPSMAFF